MGTLTATVRVESSDLALTETVAHDETAIVRPITEAGTVTPAEGYLFSIRSDDFERFEAGLEADPTIADFERVMELESTMLYRFVYADTATLLSPIIAAANGISLDWKNDGTAWIIQIWLPDRSGLSYLWEYASEHDIEFSLLRVNDHGAPVESDADLTDSQREAILVALEMGYFEEPREATLEDVAVELDISQPAAGGLLRRGLKRLVLSTVAATREKEQSRY